MLNVLTEEMVALRETDPEMAGYLAGEALRQRETLTLIASENYASRAVQAVQGSCLTNKYAEGYPGKRYYAGCDVVDEIERCAIDRAKALFGAEYANVQPHSGSQANAAAYAACLKPGECLLGLALDQGGHLTHGAEVNFSGRFYRAVSYGLDEAGLLDLEAVARIAQNVRPKVIVGGFSAYSRTIDWQRLRAIADEVGAYLIVDMAHVAGLVAAGLYPNPLPHAHVVTTTTHKTLAGPRGGLIVSACGDEKLYRRLNRRVFPGEQGGPLMQVVAAKAVALLEAAQPEFRRYQRQVLSNAARLAELFQRCGYRVVSTLR